MRIDKLFKWFFKYVFTAVPNQPESEEAWKRPDYFWPTLTDINYIHWYINTDESMILIQTVSLVFIKVVGSGGGGY